MTEAELEDYIEQGWKVRKDKDEKILISHNGYELCYHGLNGMNEFFIHVYPDKTMFVRGIIDSKRFSHLTDDGNGWGSREPFSLKVINDTLDLMFFKWPKPKGQEFGEQLSLFDMEQL